MKDIKTKEYLENDSNVEVFYKNGQEIFVDSTDDWMYRAYIFDAKSGEKLYTVSNCDKNNLMQLLGF